MYQQRRSNSPSMFMLGSKSECMDEQLLFSKHMAGSCQILSLLCSAQFNTSITTAEALERPACMPQQAKSAFPGLTQILITIAIGVHKSLTRAAHDAHPVIQLPQLCSERQHHSEGRKITEMST